MICWVVTTSLIDNDLWSKHWNFNINATGWDGFELKINIAFWLLFQVSYYSITDECLAVADNYLQSGARGSLSLPFPQSRYRHTHARLIARQCEPRSTRVVAPSILSVLSKRSRHFACGPLGATLITATLCVTCLVHRRCLVPLHRDGRSNENKTNSEWIIWKTKKSAVCKSVIYSSNHYIDDNLQRAWQYLRSTVDKVYDAYVEKDCHLSAGQIARLSKHKYASSDSSVLNELVMQKWETFFLDKTSGWIVETSVSR